LAADEAASMNVTVRQAATRDLAALLRFEQGIIDAERAFDPTIQPGFVHYYDIAAMLNSDRVRFLVAEADGTLIGCGYARIESAERFLRHTVHAYLGFMYVDPRYRGQSVNGRIVAELKAWCRSRQITELRLEVYHGNVGAIGAYRKAGFAEHVIEMRLNLADE
jgi:GNAT superfamily N-acetyltransferase